MNFCPDCGQKSDGTSKFCTSCGRALSVQVRTEVVKAESKKFLSKIRSLRFPIWILYSVVGLFLIGAVVFGVLTASNYSVVDDLNKKISELEQEMTK